MLEHDPAAALAVAVGEQAERELDPLGVVVRRLGELVDRERRGGDDEQRLDRPGELVDRVRGDQAERAIHSASSFCVWAETLIGANGAACSSAISPVLRSSSSARKATAWSTRESEPTSASKSKRRRRRRTARKRSRNCETGGKRSDMCASETSRRRRREQAQRRGELLRVLRRELPLRTRRERRRADAEVAVALAGQPLGEPDGRLLHPAVLGEPARELLGRLLGLELGELRLLVREERASLQLEQRRDQDEELAARLEVELVPLGEPLDEGDDDRGHVDLGRLQLLLQEQRQEQVEGTLERVEVQLELADDHGAAGG